MSKRHAARLTLACVVVALVAMLGAGVSASRASRSGATSTAAAGNFVLTDFGAAGDGTTDDGPALQAALDALAEAGGGTLLVPAGRYAIVTPVVKNFGGLASPIKITGVPSGTEPAPPTSGGQELTRGLDLTSEFLPRTGEAASAITISGLQSLSVEELAFVGTPDVVNDALVTLFIYEVSDAAVRHCEFYGLASMSGAVVMATRSTLKLERSVFLGSTTNSGTYTSVVQNLEWKGFYLSDTIFADYGQRPEIFSKTGLSAPFSWINLGDAAPVDNESPRREAVFKRIFMDEGGLFGISSIPTLHDSQSAPIDLLYISTLRMNVSNLDSSGLYLSDPRGVLIEDGGFGWATRSNTAATLLNVDSAIISRIGCTESVTRVAADAATERLVVIDTGCPDIDSDAPYTRVFQAATPDDDPTRYVRARFQSALGRDPEPAAHFYWADRILRCGTDAVCITGARLALTAYLALNPQPTFTLEGRATDETGAPVAGVAVTLSGSQSISTSTGADGRYHFSGLPTGGVYTVAGAKHHYTFESPQQTVVTPAGARTVNFGATRHQYQIVGRVFDEAGSIVSGATLTLSGTRAATTTTDSTGYYYFNALPAGGNYTVTPSSTLYTFTPASQAVNDLSVDTYVGFAAMPRFYSISGLVSSAATGPMGGVNVTLGGSKSATTSTNAQGFFQFTDVPRGGNYTVTLGPTVGYTFSPASKSFTNLTSDQGGNYTGVLTDFKVSGRVTLNGASFAGITVSVTGSRTATATTDSNGAYSFILPANGNYTVTPSKQHYSFAPAAATFNSLSSDRAADFAATLNRHKISGRVARANGQAMSGVAVALTGSQTGTATTDSNGDYSFTNLSAGGNYTVTPSKTGYDFSPASRTFNDLGADQSAPFVVTPSSYTVSGRVTSGTAGLSGVTVALSGARTATTTTDSNGNYSLTVTSEGVYTVTPSKQHYTFAPQSLSFTNPLSNRTADFAATINRHRISGRVARANGQAMSGVAVALSGGQTTATTTDSNGNYTFTSLPAGADYTVTPSRAGYDFAPKSKAVAGLGADQTADFTVTPGNFALAGRVTSGAAGVAGVTVTLSGSRTATATTDSNGAYSFNVSSEGSYTITPSKQHYTFAPQSLSFTNPVTDRVADFAATVNRHTIRGRVADSNNSPFGGVTVWLSGSQSATTTTDSNGEFSFANLDAGGSYTVTPAPSMFTFSPALQIFTALGADAFAGFVGTLVKYRVSGRVTEQGAALAGVALELAGTHPVLGAVGANFTTGADGSYSFEVAAGGDYTVTPSKQNYSFAPAAASIAGLASDRAADFAATPLPMFGFSAASYDVAEDGGSVTITVTRTGDATHGATIVYQALSDTARRGADFLASIGQIVFEPGEVTRNFTVFITDDAFVEGAEDFTVTLTPGEGADTDEAASAHVTINDNDASPAAVNPIEADEFFVRQHYRDFFSREPDAEGLAFWVGEINNCGANAACREARRVSVSAAFFLSIEFQETGYLVYRLYRAAYGRAPDRVEEFMLDARVMGEGVVVGRPGWEQKLAANKATSLRAFVERTRFAATYPTSLTPAQFVDALFLSAGVTPSVAERQAAIDDFAGEPTSADHEARAFALRRVAESPELNQAEYNRAFVMMQYFGYLRRNPDETPDTNLDGYNHWLGKLLEFGGDYQKAEMVKAFLASTEYRGRFGN